jgi:hypothetical protein
LRCCWALVLRPLNKRHQCKKPETSLGLTEREWSPLFLLFFTGDYQRRTVSKPQESSIVGGRTNKKQREDGDTGLLLEKNIETPDERYAT